VWDDEINLRSIQAATCARHTLINTLSSGFAMPPTTLVKVLNRFALQIRINKTISKSKKNVIITVIRMSSTQQPPFSERQVAQRVAKSGSVCLCDR
jgi:pSer/pThr/pTyr-binding forkhead associated (FHA) protein